MLAVAYSGLSGVAYAQSSNGGIFSGQGQQPASASIVEPGSQSENISPDNVWTQAAPGFVPETNATVNVNAIDAREVVADLEQLKTVLAQAPMDQPGVVEAQRVSPTSLYLPSPDGGFVEFSIRRTQLMSLELEAQYPGITTYTGYAVNDQATTISLDLTPSGFHAQVLQPGKRWFVDPQYKGDSLRHVSYYKARKSENRSCLLETSNDSALPRSEILQSRSGEILRTYTLAVAATGEYGQFFGGATPAVAAVVTTVNRVKGIYEKELAITFTLPMVAVFDDPATDPFTGNNNANVLIGESQTVLDIFVGNANYDIGHTFSTGAGGLASLGVVCNTSFKGQGVTGLANPTGDVFDVDFVAHEIGHQFGGNHTFNGANGSCSGGNRNGSTAFEPGSGSTIQAYAGICGADNLQSNSDAQMHAISHAEMINHVTLGSGSTCGAVAATGNTVPVVDALADYAIPRSTPFLLIGSGSDADANPVTYSWEQFDLGPQAALAAADDGQIPLFRVLTPSTSNFRFFPDFASVDTNTSSTSEKLPALSRAMGFGLTARDNIGGVEIDFMAVTVDQNSGPFLVTSPNGGESVSGGYLVTWDVAGTDLPPVSASTVNIAVNTAGSGLQYNTILATDTPNDGSELVNFGAIDTTTARLLISDTDTNTHTFYDISDGTFTITPPLELTCAGQAVDVDLNLGQVPTTGSDVIYGTPLDDTINGLGGDDVICGGDGFDTIYGGPGSDTIYGGDSLGNDTTFNDLFGGSGDDSVFGSEFDDYLYGQGGSDYLEGLNSATTNQDQFWGGSADDVMISNSAGGSLMRGQGNNDLIFGSSFADEITGDPGADQLFGNDGSDSIIGGNGRDYIEGGDGDDSIAGAGQRDTLFGGAGDDTLLGGLGNDALDGGPHVNGDTCNGQGQETIGAGDTENDCEFSSGFPREPVISAGVQAGRQPNGRLVLTEQQVRLIDNCDRTVEECLGLTQASR